MAGTYRIENFVNDVSLQPGIPATRRDLPALELNVSPFTWVIAQSATGQGYLYVLPHDCASQTLIYTGQLGQR